MSGIGVPIFMALALLLFIVPPVRILLSKNVAWTIKLKWFFIWVVGVTVGLGVVRGLVLIQARVGDLELMYDLFFLAGFVLVTILTIFWGLIVFSKFRSKYKTTDVVTREKLSRNNNSNFDWTKMK